MTTQLVSEFASNDFVPGYAAKAEIAVQSRPSENTPIRLLLTGFATSAGSMSDDTIVGPILSEEQAASVAGAPSELARAFRASRAMSKDIEVWFGSVAEPSGTAATAVFTIGGSWSVAGEIGVIVDGDRMNVLVGASDSAADVADAIEAKLATLPGYSYTLTIDSATGTAEKVHAGTRGNSSILYFDLTLAPSGLTVELKPPLGALLSLVNELRTDLLAHFALTSGGVHGASDTTNIAVITASAATTYAEAITLVNQLRTAYEAHRVLTSGSVHGAADSTNAVSTAAATTAAEAVTLANEIKADYNAHRILTAGSVHGAADSTNATTATDAGTGLVTGDEITGSGLRFQGGTGTEDVASLITAIKAHEKHFKRAVVSSLDSTNLGLWETFANDQAGPMVQKPTLLILAHVGTQSAAQAISKTQLNHDNFECLGAYDAETPAAEIAACHAADRVLTERNAPGGWNSSYSGKVLPGVNLARDRSKIPLDHSTQKSMLQNGLSPLVRNANGETAIVRAITTKCQAADGSDFYGALDVAEPVVVYEVREQAVNVWRFFRSQNPHVRDNFTTGETVIAKVATPEGFSRYLAQQLRPLVEERVFESAPVVRSTYNRSTKRIQTTTEFTRLALHEQGEGLVRSLV